jgi:aurora kinase
MVVMVQEYAGGGSACRVRRKLGGRMTEFQTMHLVLLPLLGVLSYLHERGIVHRDI